MDEERYLNERLAELQREYHERARPMIDRLVRIESLKPPKPMLVQLDANGHILVPEAFKDQPHD